ncbi:alpha/beta hydrolase [Candidatus Woesearchaeota archaeon]|nr:alpha/beta hydrolase [Candidatus Woesearchaeota archaeon]
MKKKCSIKAKDAIKFYYFKSVRKKDAPYLIYIHGLGGNATMWKEIEAENVKLGLNSICIDLRGHGISDTPEEPEHYKLERIAEDICAVIKKEKIKDFSFIGHSFGGSMAMVFCTIYNSPKPSSFVFIQSCYEYPYAKNRELNLNPLINIFFRKLIKMKIITNKVFPRIPELDFFKVIKENFIFQIFDELYYTPMKTIFNCLDASKEYTDKDGKKLVAMLKSTKIPTLIISSKRDETVPTTYSKELHKFMPHSELTIYEDATHSLPIERGIEVGQRINSFLQRG